MRQIRQTGRRVAGVFRTQGNGHKRALNRPLPLPARKLSLNSLLI